MHSFEMKSLNMLISKRINNFMLCSYEDLNVLTLSNISYLFILHQFIDVSKHFKYHSEVELR